MRAGPAHAKRRGACLWATRAARSRPSNPAKRLLAQRVISCGKEQAFRPSEEKKGIQCSRVWAELLLSGFVSRRIKWKKKSPRQGPYFFASLNSFEVTRICKESGGLIKGQSASQAGSIDSFLNGKLLNVGGSNTSATRKSSLSAFSVGRGFLPSIHSRGVTCARLASTTAPASHPGKKVLLKTGWWQVRRCQYRGGGRYVGRPRQRRPSPDLSFNCGRACACGQQDCLQHHGRLLRNRRHVDGLRFYIRSDGNNDFLFRPSGRHLEVSSSLIGAAFLRALTTLTDELSVKVLRVSRMPRTIGPSLRWVSNSTQS